MLVLYVLSIFLLIGCSEVVFNPQEVPAGSQSNYNMKLSMDTNGLFSAHISIVLLTRLNVPQLTVTIVQ